jgi:hypothetical protein
MTTVWVLFDSMNEEVVGVFTSRKLAEKASRWDPQSNVYLSIEEHTLDKDTVRT